MRFFSIVLTVLLSFGIAACARTKTYETEGNDNMKYKVLVAYFSATGTTARKADNIADATSATLYEIQPLRPYSNADINWNNNRSRSSLEMKDENSRPEIDGNGIDVSQYDIVFIGYPIWWNLAPRVINTFIEKNNLSGKLVPFATSGGSPISGSVKALKKKYPDIRWHDGRLLNGADKSDIEKWIKQLDIHSKIS